MARSRDTYHAIVVAFTEHEGALLAASGRTPTELLERGIGVAQAGHALPGYEAERRRVERQPHLTADRREALDGLGEPRAVLARQAMLLGARSAAPLPSLAIDLIDLRDRYPPGTARDVLDRVLASLDAAVADTTAECRSALGA